MSEHKDDLGKQSLLVLLSVILGCLGTVVVDAYMQPKLYYTEELIVGPTLSRNTYIIHINSSGVKHAEDITCRISLKKSRITKATTRVNGDFRSVIPDFPNAVLDKITYLNRGMWATFEIEADGPPGDELYILIVGKGVQAEKQTPLAVKNRSKEWETIVAIVIVGLVGYIMATDARQKRIAA